jgi:hypothetical protein
MDRIATAVILVLLAVALYIAQGRGRITNQGLTTATNIATVVGLILAVIVIFLPEQPSKIDLSFDGGIYENCPGGRVIESNIDPRTISRNESSDRRREQQNDVIVADAAGIAYDISNNSEGNMGLVIENSAVVSVTATEVQDHVNIAVTGGCGAGPNTTYYFEPIQLARYSPNALQTIHYTKDNTTHFTIEPGKSLRFGFTFNCREPGVYSLSIDIAYKIAAESQVKTLKDKELIVCPRNLSIWSDYNITNLQDYDKLILLGRITEDGVNFRQEPGTNKAIIKSLSRGEVVEVFEDRLLVDNITWIKVGLIDSRTPNTVSIGWVSSEFLELEQQCFWWWTNMKTRCA